MKTLIGIIGTEICTVSVVRFTDEFEVKYNSSNSITIKCFSGNNAIRIHEAFLDDCNKKYKDNLRNAITCVKSVDEIYMTLKLDTNSDFNFGINHKDGYTVVSIVVIKDVMEIM